MVYAKWKWELPLNKDDRRWISSAIDQAVQRSARTESAPTNDAVLPHGPVAWTRDHKLAAGILAFTIIGVFVAYFAWWQPQHTAHEEQDFGLKVDKRFDSKFEQPLKDIHQIQVDVAGIDAKLDELNTLLPSIVQNRWKDGWKLTPRNLKQSVPEIKKLVAVSKQRDITTVPVRLVANTGESLVPLAKDNPEVWDVAQDVLSYRTALNRDLLLVGTAEQLATTPAFKEGPSARFFNAPPGYDGPHFTAGGRVPPDRAALMGILNPENPENLGNPLPDVGLSKQVILGEGGAILLDGMVLRHVVLRKTQVFYNGGLTKLEDVIFVDCTFVLKNEPAARLFALAVLGQTQVRFQPTKQ